MAKLNSFVEDLMVECCRSTKVLAKTLMPERFCSPFSSYLHDPIFELIDSDAPRIAIAAPRGTGKTSISIAKATQASLFRLRRFIPWVSTSHDVATMQTENLKREMLAAPEIKKLFGSVKTRGASELDESFSKKSWVAFDHTLVLPRGCGQQVRGVLFGSARPDLIIVDDLEHPEEINSDELRVARKTWFWADLMKCVSRFDKNWKIIYIDTLKHEDALLQDLLDSKDWESVRLEVCDDDLNPTAPDIMSAEEIKASHQSHRDLGMLDVFYREYRNIAISTEDATFQPKYFKHYEEPLDKPSVENILIIDPAKTVKLHSAESAIVCVGIDTAGQAIYVRDVVARKMYPDELYEELFQMAARFRTRIVGVEVTSLNEFITQPIRNEMLRRGEVFELVELKARGKKEQRIASLVPYYRQGFIHHNVRCCTAMESQLTMFPRSKRVDIIDALAYTIEMMDLGQRFFEPPPIENSEDEYAELNYEPSFADWRYV